MKYIFDVSKLLLFIIMEFFEVFITLFSISFASFIWEYVARKKETNFKPSVLLNFFAEKLISFYKFLGRTWALISSFYTLIDLGELKGTFYDLVKPTIDIMISPFYTFAGYIDKMNIYNHPYLIVFGSITLVSILGYLGYYFKVFSYIWQLINPYYYYLISYMKSYFNNEF